MADRQAIRDFLQRVGTEPAFRAQLEQDPIATLAQAGMAVSNADVPPEGIKLPSNAAILANLDHLAERADGTAGEVFFKL